ncbi:MAG: hypothetical protein B7X79_13655 [Acidovorax sp. 17-64-282]|nr:MAG: hypothetical protein B7Y20_01790 [Acidovorax sp. 16-64-162]OYZ69875.1 MAG: hypothetical protein B7Y14_06495 [Acidovorax sp. 24-64-9]OZA55768.1 MAG: hypothetical protein B7X79_13655 [Acidovorax sp. 17-64-282]OZA69431.1 MAG: hypothetical protein B7X70_10935 [Acidovorax sp. 39-64-12]HQS63782.1 hypothetical protein [Acidovorax defluvii]
MVKTPVLARSSDGGQPHGKKGHRATKEPFRGGVYHLPMRRILSLALVVMLVLRGLMGTAMAAGVVPPLPIQSVQTVQKAAPATPTAHASAIAGHPGHALHATPGDDHHAAAPVNCHDTPTSECGPHEHSPSCADCDICHSAMLAPPALPAQPLHLRGAVRSADSVPFASVQAARTIKPPIA